MKKFEAKWKTSLPIEEEGIIVGCSESHEWLLPWWWMNYSLFNWYPVTFINFGDMSEKAIAWCKERGNILTLDIPTESFVVEKEEIDENLQKIWNKTGSIIWYLRSNWFKKPFALLETPYKKTLWLDADCQVRGSLKPLFEEYLGQSELCIAPERESEQQLNKERGFLLPGELMHNSGVIAFKYGSSIIQEWVDTCIEQNHLLMGDQQVLSRILFSKKYKITELPIIYNWPAAYGDNDDAIIIHWWGAYQEFLRLELSTLLQDFCIDLRIK